MAAAKTNPETRVSLTEPLRIAKMPVSRQSRLKKRHCESMRKLLESTSCQGFKPKSAAATNPVDLPYNSLPSRYTKTTDPSPKSVTKDVPVLTDKPKIL